MAVATDRGYSDSRWATYGQIQAAGDRIRKGERGTHILSFKTHRRVAVRDEKGQPVKDKNGEQVYRHEKLARPFTRIYTVFNVEQARNIKAEPRPEPGKAWEAHKRAEDVIKASGVPVKNVQGDRAYYSLGSDQVVLPEKSQFPSADHYYQTALHELGHASGHPDRLNRDTLQKGVNGGFGSEAYAREELRAEISAMMTGDRLGTGHDPSRGAAYVSSWVEVLDKNPQEIVNASAEAQRMSNYLISRTRERRQDQGEKTQDGAVPGQQQEPHYRVVLDKSQTAWRIENASDPSEKLPSLCPARLPQRLRCQTGAQAPSPGSGAACLHRGSQATGRRTRAGQGARPAVSHCPGSTPAGRLPHRGRQGSQSAGPQSLRDHVRRQGRGREGHRGAAARPEARRPAGRARPRPAGRHSRGKTFTARRPAGCPHRIPQRRPGPGSRPAWRPARPAPQPHSPREVTREPLDPRP